jgi:membrane protease YdiL (CAAX protease family)
MILLPIAFSIVVLVIYIERLIRHTKGEKIMAKLRLGNPNEILMLIFGLGVVLAWVIIAATASYYSIVEVREITDSQLTVIGLLGGPALLIITSVLDLFKGKEGAKINILPDQLASDVTAAEAVDAHTRMLEEYKLKHDLEMEKMQKQHSLDMEAYQITNGKTKNKGE